MGEVQGTGQTRRRTGFQERGAIHVFLGLGDHDERNCWVPRLCESQYFECGRLICPSAEIDQEQSRASGGDKTDFGRIQRLLMGELATRNTLNTGFDRGNKFLISSDNYDFGVHGLVPRGNLGTSRLGANHHCW